MHALSIREHAHMLKTSRMLMQVARLFRAHWTDDSAHRDSDELEVFGGRSARARDGLRLLMRTPRMRVEMLSGDDWGFLFRHCDSASVRTLQAYRHDLDALPADWKEIEDHDQRAPIITIIASPYLT